MEVQWLPRPLLNRTQIALISSPRRAGRLIRDFCRTPFGMACLILLFAAMVFWILCETNLIHRAIGVGNGIVPLSVRIVEHDGSPAAHIQVECAAISGKSVVVITDPAGRAEGMLPVTTSTEWIGPFRVRNTWGPGFVDVHEVSPDGHRSLLQPIKFTRTARSMSVVCQRKPPAEPEAISRKKR